MASSWAVKRISSTSGGGNKGSVNANFQNALAKDESQPGESEVLWIQPENGGSVLIRRHIYSLQQHVFKVAGRLIAPFGSISSIDQTMV